jgi:hypothetical protein
MLDILKVHPLPLEKGCHRYQTVGIERQGKGVHTVVRDILDSKIHTWARDHNALCTPSPLRIT